MATTESTPTTTTTTVDVAQVGERKPLMSGTAILMMNLGFFGVQFSFGLTQSAVNPLFLLIGANPDQLPILNIAGPITGLVIQPLIGATSDKTWSPRWGRRQPVHPGGRVPVRDHPVRLPVRRRALAGRGLPLAARRRQQHLDGAVSGTHLRSVARVATRARVPDAEHVHRRRRGAGEPVPVHPAEGAGATKDRRQRGALLDVRLLHDRHGRASWSRC